MVKLDLTTQRKKGQPKKVKFFVKKQSKVLGKKKRTISESARQGMPSINVDIFHR